MFGSDAVCGAVEAAAVHPGLGVGPRDGRPGGAAQARVRGRGHRNHRQCI